MYVTHVLNSWIIWSSNTCSFILFYQIQTIWVNNRKLQHYYTKHVWNSVQEYKHTQNMHCLCNLLSDLLVMLNKVLATAQCNRFRYSYCSSVSEKHKKTLVVLRNKLYSLYTNILQANGTRQIPHEWWVHLRRVRHWRTQKQAEAIWFGDQLSTTTLIFRWNGETHTIKRSLTLWLMLPAGW